MKAKAESARKAQQEASASQVARSQPLQEAGDKQNEVDKLKSGSYRWGDCDMENSRAGVIGSNDDLADAASEIAQATDK